MVWVETKEETPLVDDDERTRGVMPQRQNPLSLIDLLGYPG